ncbi:DJ-1 domain protein [Fusarium sp. NRRL 52700]|nr:DJ-1 domain protein [Fusarium sp. NRRL 52700]
MSTSAKRYNVGILVFDGVDILDFAGPIEVFSHVSHNKNPDNPDRVYKCRTIGRSHTIRAADSLTVAADLLISEALLDLQQFDILVVPGAPPSIITPLLTPESLEMQLVAAFAELPPRISNAEPRILFSVCVGAFFLGAAGVLDGLNATTHHRALGKLEEICRAIEKEPASIVEKRFVDGGLSKNKAVSVVTAGGISSGLDAALHIVGTQTSKDMEQFLRRVMEYS